MIPVQQTCPVCGDLFMGSDVVGLPCMNCDGGGILDEDLLTSLAAENIYPPTEAETEDLSVSTTTHETIIVTGQVPNHLSRVRTEAERLFDWQVSAKVPGTVNGQESFFIAPSGSKDGWEEAETHTDRTRQFIDKLATMDVAVTVMLVRFNPDNDVADVIELWTAFDVETHDG